MKILVTGAAGYIGSVLTPLLLTQGHEVTAVDNFRYGQHLALAEACRFSKFEVFNHDTRDYNFITPLVRDADIIIPLAALVGAPLCDRQPNDATSTNYHAIDWISSSVSKGQRIIYPNTNSGYGFMTGNAPLTEESPQNPLSLYASAKQQAEEAVLHHENSVVFRLATVFGASPRMRTDLLVNDLVLRAVRDRSCTLYDPLARRNYVHVRDVARAFCWAIVNGWGVYNLGHDAANCTKQELCDYINEFTPFHYHIGPGTDPDKRDYLISNQKLDDAGFETWYGLDDGIPELIKLYQSFPTTLWGNV